MANVGLKELIWRYLDVPKLVELNMEIVTPATSEKGGWGRTCTVTNMLAGTEVWLTTMIPAGQVESVIFGVASGSRVTSFDVASLGSKSLFQMCVEEVAADGTVGATLVTWNHFGAYSVSVLKPRGYTPTTIAVETTATRFKVSVLHTFGHSACAGLAVFRATGVAPPRLSPRPPLNYEQLAYFTTHGCVKPKHESAVKRAIWDLTLGLAHLRGEKKSTSAFQALQSTTLKLKIWKFMSLPLEVELPMSITRAATSEDDSGGYAHSVVHLLAGTSVWKTDSTAAGHEESVVVQVPKGSIVTSFALASLAPHRDHDMRVEALREVKKDGVAVVSAEVVVPWNHYGKCVGFAAYVSSYTPDVVAVKRTKAVCFRISTRQTFRDDWATGVAVFRAVGIADAAP